MAKITHIIPGETYLVRQWEDMVEEYGLHPSGHIRCSFNKRMRYLCGTTLTAPQVLHPSGGFSIPMKDDPDDTWYISPEMLEPAIWNVNGDD